MKIYLAGGASRYWIYDMHIYLAGGISGNLKPGWKKVVKNEDIEQLQEGHFEKLAGHFLEEDSKALGLYDEAIAKHKPFILESFYYADADTERLIPLFGDFMLDSGAFTFMQGNGVVDWVDYVERYADFINRNNVEKFFELDIDSVVGYNEVLKLRERLERLTNRRSIPVWHKSRGVDDFLSMCDAYPYVALGGIVTGEFKSTEYRHFPHLINEAHKRGAKIHGLGFTALSWLPKCHFDSVDSTAWTTGNRFGFIYRFDGKTMRKTNAPEGHRLGDPRKVALINYVEWIKFQRYAEVHL